MFLGGLAGGVLRGMGTANEEGGAPLTMGTFGFTEGDDTEEDVDG